MMRRFLAVLLVGVMCASCICLAGCGGSSSSSSSSSAPSSPSSVDVQSVYEYLGDFDYEASTVALVYEPVEDEDEYGIQYRIVKDIDGILNGSVPVMMYFYSSLSRDSYGVTAGVEDIAQCTWGEMLVVMVDVLDNDELISRYEIGRVPEFVIVKGGSELSRFEGYNYEVWTMNDVALWVSSCGIRVDYSKLEIE